MPIPKELFVSHASPDQRILNKLVTVLDWHGVPHWYSRKNLLGAQQWHDEIGAALKHVVQSCFDGRRIAIFSGGAREEDAALLEEVKAIHEGGGFGSIIGRNSFQRPKAEAIALLTRIMAIYAA